MEYSSKDKSERMSRPPAYSLVLSPVAPEAMDTNSYTWITGMSRMASIPSKTSKQMFLQRESIFSKLFNSLYSEHSCKVRSRSLSSVSQLIFMVYSE